MRYNLFVFNADKADIAEFQEKTLELLTNRK